MKKYLHILLGAVAMLAVASCTNDIDNNQVVSSAETLHIVVTPEVAPLDGAELTKTHIDENNTIIWDADEQMKIAVLADGDATKATFGNADAAASGSASTSFAADITPSVTGDDYTFVGLYPASASTNTSVTAQSVMLKAKQDALESSYDPKSYILVARHEDGKTAANASWTAYYKRATALNKLTLKGIDEDLVSVTIKAEGKDLAGYRTFDLLNDQAGNVTEGVDHIEVSYATPLTGADVDGVNNKVVWFNSWDVELSQGAPLTIVAKSEAKTYTRTINANANGIKFKEGKLNTLSVNMAATDVDVEDNTQNYVKVTSASDLTSGQYLIVYEAGNVAFNGGLTTLDAVGNTIAVTINDGVIESSATTDAAAFTIDVAEGTIKSASGYYIGVTSYSNGLTQNEETTYAHSIEMQSGNALISIYNSGWTNPMYLQYNKASNQTRFRYFKNGGQESIQLYKKTGSSASAVTWNLQGIEITTPATKLTYGEGETFSPAGMVVTATYVDESDATNAKTEVLTTDVLTFVPALTAPLTLSDNKVTISYDGKTATQAITVEDRYVTLDWTYPTEGAATATGISEIKGVIANGIGSYTSGGIKMSDTGSFIQIKTDSQIGEVSLDVTANGGTTSVITISASANGSDWTVVESFTLATGVFTTTNTFASDARFVKIGFTKNSGNADIDGITITKVDPTPRFTVESPIEAVIAGGGYTANITRKFFDGEITVTVPEGCDWITASNVAAGANALSLTVAANTGVARSATLTLSATDVTSQELVVNQVGNEPGTEANPYNVAQALAAIDALESGSTGTVWVSGIISKVASYSNNTITYYISADGTQTSQLEVYKGKDVNGANFTDITDLAVGDQVTVKGTLTNYNGTTPEFNSNSQITAINYATRYTVTYSNDGNGSVTGPTSVGAQGSVTVAVSPNTGYELNALTVGDVDVTAAVSSNEYTFTMPASDVAVAATFKKSQTGDDIWTLITSLSNITDGTYAIAALNSDKYYTVPNTTISGQTFTCTEASYSVENGLTLPSGAGEFVFTAVSGEENAFYIYNTNLNKYLVATGSKKFGYVDATSSDYGYWTFSTVSSGGFSGVFSVKHDNKDHYMRAYNASVRCYDGASNNGVYLFIKN